MSSKFTNVYDEIRTRISGVLTTYTELNNPYSIEDDADIMFDKAWTLGIGVGTNTNRVICNQTTVGREFVLTIAYRFFATDRDITTRITAEKALINAQLDVLNSFSDQPTTTNIIKANYVSDTGVQFLAGNRWGFLVLQTILEVEYFDSI